MSQSRPYNILYARAVPLVSFPVGHNRAGNVEGTVCDPFIGSPSTCPRAQEVRAQTMENSEKGLRAEVATNYLRLTDATIRAATLPPGKSQYYLHDTEQPGLAIRMRATGGRTWSSCSPSLGREAPNARRWAHGPSSMRRPRARQLPSPPARWSLGSIRTTPNARQSGNSWQRGSALRWRP